MKKFTIGMVFGTFDLFHPGHEFYISQASHHAEKIIAVIARDNRVLEGKGFLPNENENIRRQKVENFLKTINAENIAILGDEKNIFIPLYNHHPEIIFFGYDQKVPENFLKETFPNIATMRIGNFFPEKYKSSILRQTKNPK